MAGGRLLSLASGVLAEFTAEQTVIAAIAAGWPAVGIWVDFDRWTATTGADVRNRAADAGIVVLDVEVIWLKPGGDDAMHFRIVDAGAEIGARNVLIVSSDPEPRSTAAKLARLADHAAARQMRVSLEFGAFTAVKSMTAALAILDRTERPDAGLLIDPLHLARTGSTPQALRSIDARRFSYAQFCDAPAVGADPADFDAIIHEALDLRLPIGAGELPLAGLLDALPAGTPLSVELRSRTLRDSYPDATDRARALLASTRAGLAKLDRAILVA